MARNDWGYGGGGGGQPPRRSGRGWYRESGWGGVYDDEFRGYGGMQYGRWEPQGGYGRGASGGGGGWQTGGGPGGYGYGWQSGGGGGYGGGSRGYVGADNRSGGYGGGYGGQGSYGAYAAESLGPGHRRGGVYADGGAGYGGGIGRGEYGGAYPGYGGYPGGGRGEYYGGGGYGPGRPSQGRGGGVQGEYARAPFMPEEAYRRHPEYDQPPRRWVEQGWEADEDPSDDDLVEAVRQRMEGDPWLDPARIEVAVDDGVVTLTGEVDDFLEARYAWDDAWETAGVRGVVNNLTVRTDQPGDTHGDVVAQSSGEPPDLEPGGATLWSEPGGE